MSVPADPAAPSAPVDPRVLVAAVVLAVGALPAVLLLPHDRVRVDATLLVLGWIPVGAAGVLLLDRRPEWRLGRAAVALSLVPLAATVADPSPWWLIALFLLPLCSVPGGATSARAARRWRGWLVLLATATCSFAVLADLTARDSWVGPVAAGGLLAVAAVLGGAAVVETPRALAEPLLDAALTLGVLVVAAAVGGLIWAVASQERIFGAGPVGGFAAAITAVLAAPAALAGRQRLLAARYGTGVLSADDVASMTADLGALSDPRELLGKAGEIVAAASGVEECRVLLDRAEEDPRWVTHPLLVGSLEVGTMALRPVSAEGLEARQAKVVAQLVPTVALVARAVSLAVEAEHARSDVSRERNAERARVLHDLHDDLGPLLAGMSMRVRAAQESSPHPALETLAVDLTTARADLRRIVSGLTPGPLAESGPGEALRSLVESFRTEDGPRVRLEGLEGGVPPGVEGERAVVVYRTLAEALTNALRHAGASEVLVSLAEVGGRIRLVVEDDGSGGVLVPGVGLMSLRTRATAYGGSVTWGPGTMAGTRLELDLPTGPPAGADR